MSSWHKEYKHLCIYWLARLLVAVVNLLPRRAALALGQALGSCVFALSVRDARTAVRNLRMVYPEKRSEEIMRFARQTFSELGKNGADALRLTDLDGLVECEGWTHLVQALGKGRGVICVTGHLGCWELMPQYVGARGERIRPVAGTVYDHRVDTLVKRLRERSGVRVIDRKNGLKEAIRVLRKGEILGVLVDQGSRRDGVIVDFFGRPTGFPRGPVSLSLKTGAPIVPAAIFRKEDDTHLIQVGEEIRFNSDSDSERALTQGTQACAAALEEYIRRRPTQWVWSYPRWEDPAE